MRSLQAWRDGIEVDVVAQPRPLRRRYPVLLPQGGGGNIEGVKCLDRSQNAVTMDNAGNTQQPPDNRSSERSRIVNDKVGRPPANELQDVVDHGGRIDESERPDRSPPAFSTPGDGA